MANNIFDLYPRLQKEHVVEQVNGCVIISVLRFKSSILQRLFGKVKSKYIKIPFEEHGSAVINLIDGSNSVRDICSKLNNHFLGEEGYEYRIAYFLTKIEKDGFIKFNKNKSIN